MIKTKWIIAILLLPILTFASLKSKRLYKKASYNKVYIALQQDIKKDSLKLSEIKWLQNTAFWLFSNNYIDSKKLIDTLEQLKNIETSNQLVPKPNDYIKVFNKINLDKTSNKWIIKQVEKWKKIREPLFKINIEKRAWLRVLKVIAARKFKKNQHEAKWALTLAEIDIASKKKESKYIDLILRSKQSSKSQKKRAAQLKKRLSRYQPSL